MSFLLLKSLHIVSVVAWFAGLFYIVRLFVYIAEAHDRPPAERDILLPQLRLMARRLWFGITWPAGIATLVFGGAILHLFWPPPHWMRVKLAWVAGLLVYHGLCHWLHARAQSGPLPWSSRSLRVWNEVATVLLVAIVFTVVLKDALWLGWVMLGLVLFSALLMVGIAVYRRIRAPREK